MFYIATTSCEIFLLEQIYVFNDLVTLLLFTIIDSVSQQETFFLRYMFATFFLSLLFSFRLRMILMIILLLYVSLEFWLQINTIKWHVVFGSLSCFAGISIAHETNPPNRENVEGEPWINENWMLHTHKNKSLNFSYTSQNAQRKKKYISLLQKEGKISK